MFSKLSISRRAVIALCSAVIIGGAGSAEATTIRLTVGEYSGKTRSFFERVAKDYAVLHPDVHIQVEVVPWDGYLQKLTTDIGGGDPPDLSIVPTIWIPDMVAQNTIESFDDVMSPAFKATFIQPFLAPSTINGRLMGLPAAASARAMVVNLDLLKQAGAPEPKTWDEFRAAAERMSKLSNVYGFGLPGKEIEVDTYFYYALWSFGGDILKDGRSGLDSPEAIKAATFYKNLVEQKLTEPSPTAYSREDVFNLFKQGKVGMVFSYPMLIPQLKAEAPDLHYAVMPFPTDKVPTTLGVTDVLVRYSGSKVKKEAWDFVQFTYRHDYRTQFDRDEGFLPVTTDVLAEEYYKKNPDISAFADGLTYARFVPTIKNWPEFADITSRALQSIYLDRDAPETAMRKAASQIDAILAGH